MKRAFKSLLLIFLFCICSITGCGGGTSGTGLSSYEGEIRRLDGSPVAGAKVTLVENNDWTYTDQAGGFMLETETLAEPGTLMIETAQSSATIKLKSNPGENEKVQLRIQLSNEGSSDQVAQISEFALSAQVVGGCDRYFENREYIRQANHVPSGVECILKAKVMGDGEPRAHIPVAIQSRACRDGSLWVTEESSITEGGVHEGTVQIPFHFFSSREKCQYRVIAPYNYKQYEPIVYPFKTFAELEFGR